MTKENCKSIVAGNPVISVITVVFNGDEHLEQTLQSVINQTYTNVEYIVIDGASTDNTPDIIRQYDAIIDYWISEPDNGIADAMNKGLHSATGEYILFLHADDYFENNQSLAQAVTRIGYEDIALFDILYGGELKYLTPRGLNFWINFKTGVFHQAALCKRSVFDRIGGFDTGLKIAMDYDFFLRAYRHGITPRHYPLALSVMRDTGISSKTDWPALLSRFNEEKKVHLKNCHSLPLSFIYKIYWVLYLNYRKIRHRYN